MGGAAVDRGDEMKMQLLCAATYITRLAKRLKPLSSVTAFVLMLTCLVGGFMATTSLACATEQKPVPRMINHAFIFDANSNIELLNFQYGDSKSTGTYVEDAQLAEGRVAQGGGVRGTMPVGDFLYVKWRILATGGVHEDRVDLKNRLPSDIGGKIITFAIEGQQLNVYLIEGNSTKQLHAPGAAHCPVSPYQHFQCTRIYPEHWANF